MAQFSSAATVERAMQGDQVAFAELVSDHDADLMRVAVVITGDPVAAREAVQDAWHQAWRRRRQLRDAGRFRAWLMAIASNEARQGRRRRLGRQRRETGLEKADSVGSTDAIPDPDLATALSRLHPRDREIVAYRFVLGWSSPEIAEVTGLSPSGARVRLSRAIEQLRRELS